MRASTVRVFFKYVLAAFVVCQTNAAGTTQAPLSADAARDRLETLGLPLGPDAFARAVATHHAPIIDLCFAAHLDPDAPDAQGRTPLLIASLHQDWEIVRRLLTLNVRVETPDGDGVTPLMVAAMHGHTETLRALLAAKANADARDHEGRAAIHYAAAAAKLSTIEALLPLTTGLDAACTDGRDLLEIAFDAGDEKIIPPILQRLPPRPQWTAGTRRALNAALLAANKDQIRLLLSKHTTPPTLDGRTGPLLAYAIAMDEAPLFNILLACGADPNTTLPKPFDKELTALFSGNYLRHYVEEDQGVTVLMLAAGLGKADFVRALLDAGADRNRSTAQYKMLALYFAARTENWQCLQMLLGSGLPPDQLRVEVSLSSQSAAVIKDGVTIFTTGVSTGRKGFSTPAGKYVVTDKDRNHRSTIYKVPMPYFMRLSCRDFGMHEGAVPDYPASHGCIRLPSAAARKLFAEIPVGTLVTIN